MGIAENDASSMHLAIFILKDKVIFQGNDLCQDWRQRKYRSDWAENRGDPWDRGECNDNKKSDLFYTVKWPHISGQLQTRRSSEPLLSRMSQSPLQKLFLSSINKKRMLKTRTTNTGKISPDNQKILSGVESLSEFIFSFMEVPSWASLNRYNSITWSQMPVSILCWASL